jgi:sugar lactone lactonase YvrE
MQLKGLRIALACLAGFTSALMCGQPYATTQAGATEQDQFPASAVWYNVQAPITMEQLQEKALLLSFTTDHCPAGIANTLALQEQCRMQAATQLVVVWRKGPGFDPEVLKEQLHLYGIYEPVVVVQDFSTFKSSGVVSLPRVCVQENAGVTDFQADTVYELPEVRMAHLKDLVEGRVGKRKFSLSRWSSDDLLLTRADPLYAYPAFIEAMPDGTGTWISDGLHHRVVLAEPDGEVNTVVGTSGKGNRDGRFPEARFYFPGGVSYHGATQTLYIADTYNHRICAAGLQDQQVSTVIGGKEPGKFRGTQPAGRLNIGLPIDVVAGNKALYFVSAWDMGVYEFDLNSEDLRRISQISPSRPDSLVSVVPTNLCIYTDTSMAVVCSNGQVFEVFIHGGQKEIIFHTEGGKAPVVSALSRFEGRLYVTDRDAHGLYVCAGDGRCKALSGFNGQGFRTGKHKVCQYNRPMDLSAGGGRLWMADTYNHQLHWMKPGKKKMNAYYLRKYEPLTRLSDAPSSGQRVTLEPFEAAEGTNRLYVTFETPGYLVVPSGKNELHADGTEGVKITAFRPADGVMELEVEPDKLPGQFQLEFYLTVSPEERPSQLFLKTIFLTFTMETGGKDASHTLRFVPEIGWR